MDMDQVAKWMEDNVELRHKVRDENLDLIKNLFAISLVGGPQAFIVALKNALYAGYIAGINANVKPVEIPDIFKKAFEDEGK